MKIMDTFFDTYTVLHKDPQIILIHGVLQILVESLKLDGEEGVLQKSTVQLYDGSRVLDSGRTSTSCHIRKRDSLEVLAKHFVPEGVPETPQYLEYQDGQFYLPHFDYFVGEYKGENRIATMIVYLTDVQEGGETNFPSLGISVKPKKGDALLFKYDNVHTQHLTLHEAKPVKKGVKNIVTMFIRKKGNEEL